jgi:hypothetical protein
MLLSMAQLLQGTSPTFSLCCFFFIVIATLAFNFAGGLSRPSGGYIFFYAILAVILGLCWKAFLGEPADSNLLQPLLTIATELCGITAMFGAIFLSQKITTRKALLGDLVTDDNMYRAAMGCMIVGLALTAIVTVVPYTSGTILSAVAQLNQFLPLSIILATIYQIRKSGGTSSVNSIVLISGGSLFLYGCISFSKEGMFTPLLCWVIASASQRYKVSRFQIGGFILVASFMVYFLVPYSQYGRGFITRSSDTESKEGAFYKNIDASIDLLSDLGDVRQKYEAIIKDQESSNSGPAYFNTSQGLLDRLQMLSMDDAIIHVTEQRGTFGFIPVIADFENVIPHFLWPEKPSFHFGNIYAHEIGMLSPDDETTGISFSPMGEAYHLGRWVGLFVVAPMLWIALFAVFDSLCGDVRRYPWGLPVLVLFAHIGPEGGFGGPAYMLTYGVVAIIFGALAAAYLMTILGSIFVGRGNRGPRRRVSIRSIPRRMPPLPASRPPLR